MAFSPSGVYVCIGLEQPSPSRGRCFPGRVLCEARGQGGRRDSCPRPDRSLSHARFPVCLQSWGRVPVSAPCATVVPVPHHQCVGHSRPPWPSKGVGSGAGLLLSGRAFGGFSFNLFSPSPASTALQSKGCLYAPLLKASWKPRRNCSPPFPLAHPTATWRTGGPQESSS